MLGRRDTERRNAKRERKGRRGRTGGHTRESVGRGAFSAFILSSFATRLLLFLGSTRSFLSVLITNRFDRHFPPSPISPLLLLSLKNIIVRYVSPFLSLSLRVPPGWNSCRLEITFNRGEFFRREGERERERESFSLVFDLIGRYKSVYISVSLSFSPFLFLSERTAERRYFENVEDSSGTNMSPVRRGHERRNLRSGASL